MKVTMYCSTMSTMMASIVLSLLLFSSNNAGAAIPNERQSMNSISKPTAGHRTQDVDAVSIHKLPRSQRQLQDGGDFDRFNDLFQGASITIPTDFEVSQDVLFISLNLQVQNINCYDISIGDISLSHSRIGNTDVDVNVNITELDMMCDIDYRYDYGLLRGGGVARVTTDNNSASTTLKFQSENYDTLPPTTSTVDQCTTSIQIVNIEFFEDLMSDLVELFEKFLRDLIETEIEGVACDELGTLGTTFVVDLLQIAENTLLGAEDDESLMEQIKNPLFVEESTILPEGVVGLDFQDTEGGIGKWFNLALEQLDTLLGDVVSDPGGPMEDKRDLGINVLMRSALLDENRTLVVNVDTLPIDAILFKGHDQLTESVITLNQIKVGGLDTLTRFNPLTPIGKHTLQNELTWEFLTLSIDVTLDIKPSSLDDAILQDSTSTGITERISIDFGVENIDVVAALYLVIDQGKLGGMELGPLLFMDNLLPCLLSIVHDFQLSGLHVDPRAINIPTLTGFVSPGIDRLVTDAVLAAFDMYSGVLEYAIPNIFQTNVRPFLNGLIEDFIASDPCPVYSPSDDLGFLDFREFFDTASTAYGQIPSMLREIVDSELLAINPETSKPKINQVLIDRFTKGQSGVEGTLAFEGNLFETGTRISVGGLDAKIELRASDAKIENLNTVNSPLVLLETVQSQPHYLNNSATLGMEDNPMRLSTRFFFSIAGDEDTQIKNELDISLDMETANVVLTAMLKIAKSRLLGFPLGDILDLNCWLATIPPPLLDDRGIRVEGSNVTAALAEVAASIARLNLNISCVDCSSPGMLELSELLATPEAQDDATIVVNMLLDSANELMSGNFLQVQIDRILNDAARKCPHSPEYVANASAIEYQPLATPESESSTSYILLLASVTIGFCLSVAVLVFAIRFIVRRRQRKWLAKLPSDQVDRIKRLQHREDAVETDLNESSQSLFQSTAVPWIVRWGMPLVIAGNIALFVSGHLSLGATVNVEAQIAGETIRVDEFFEFSMAKSTIDIWNAGGKGLAILILIFSGIWPYTKQLMTLVIWFTPPTRLSISRRGSILLWLDWLAKWSAIDIFVLVVTIAAFRVSIQSPEVSFLPEGFYSIDLLVVPLWGLYANMTAQLISQISSHFIIHYHRRIVNEVTTSLKQRHELTSTGLNNKPTSTLTLSTISDTDSKRLLWKHQYGRPHRGEDEKLVVRNWVGCSLVFLGISLATLVILGCTLPSFSLKILGLIGVAVESGQEFEDANTNHSVFTVMQLLMEEARFLDTTSAYIGLGTLSGLVGLTVLVVPILQAVFLLIQWYSPLTLRQRTRISVLTEILQAWQYAEVYIIAVFVASWQLGPISEFMVNSYCESLAGLFANMVYFGVLKEEDAQCFSVQSSIESGSLVLAAGAVLLALLNTFVTKAVTQYLRDKNELEKRIEDEKLNSCKIDETNEEKAEGSAHLHPVPVLFTDTFRWCLRNDNRQASSSRAFEAQFDLPKAASDDSRQDETTNLEAQYSSTGSRVSEEGDEINSADTSIPPPPTGYENQKEDEETGN